MTRTLIIFAVGLMILTNLVTLKQRNDLKRSNELLKDKLSNNTKLLEITHERALKYQIIAFKLDSICDSFQSSRNAKQKNKQLLKLSEI